MKKIITNAFNNEIFDLDFLGSYGALVKLRDKFLCMAYDSAAVKSMYSNFAVPNNSTAAYNLLCFNVGTPSVFDYKSLLLDGTTYFQKRGLKKINVCFTYDLDIKTNTTGSFVINVRLQNQTPSMINITFLDMGNRYNVDNHVGSYDNQSLFFQLDLAQINSTFTDANSGMNIELLCTGFGATVNAELKNLKCVIWGE